MSTETDDIFDDETTETAGESPAAKTLRKQNSKLAKDLEDMRKKIETYEKKERQSTIANTLKAAGANEKIARYVDIEGDVTEESVRTWLTDNGEIFGWQPSEEDDDEEVQVTRENTRRISKATSQAPANADRGWTPEKMRNASIDDLIAAGIISR